MTVRRTYRGSLVILVVLYFCFALYLEGFLISSQCFFCLLEGLFFSFAVCVCIFFFKQGGEFSIECLVKEEDRLLLQFALDATNQFLLK